MTKYFALFFLVGYQCVFAQSALESSKIISEKLTKSNLEIVLEERNLSWADSQNTSKYWRELENFSLFLNDPFNPSLGAIDVAKVVNILQNAEIEKNIYGEKSGIDFNNMGILNFLNSLKSDEVTSTSMLTSPISSGVSFSTKLIDGASKFLVDRTKRELSLSFYESFYNKLNRPLIYKLNEKDTVNLYLRDVLPNAYMLFDSKSVFETPSFGQTWSTAFQNDIIELPFSITESFKKNPLFRNNELGRFSLIMMGGLKQIEEGNHPISVIESLAADYQKFESFQTDAHLGLVNLITKNCTVVEESNRKLANLVTFNTLTNDEKKYFTALIYQQGLKDGIFKPANIGTTPLYLNINKDNYDVFYQGIRDIQRLLISTNNKNATSDKSKNTDENSDFVFYSTVFSNIINKTYEMVIGINNSDYYDSSFYKKYLPISKDISNFYEGKQNTNYGVSVLSTINYLNHLSHQKENKNFIQEVTYYGNFLVDIIFATSHDGIDIESIINKYAMPVSSYRIKRMYKMSIDLNAYPGLYVGYEFSNSNSPNFGITAPIGFSFSTRSKSNNEQYAASHSIFISAIDIGAPFSYRFVNDSAEGLPENIKWEQIFSPGIFYIYGFKKSPLVLSAGLQFTPLLRKIETENVLDHKNVLRVGIGLNVDIPIINLYKRLR